jgi:hypothetical protein
MKRGSKKVELGVDFLELIQNDQDQAYETAQYTKYIYECAETRSKSIKYCARIACRKCKNEDVEFSVSKVPSIDETKILYKLIIKNKSPQKKLFGKNLRDSLVGLLQEREFYFGDLPIYISKHELELEFFEEIYLIGFATGEFGEL